MEHLRIVRIRSFTFEDPVEKQGTDVDPLEVGVQVGRLCLPLLLNLMPVGVDYGDVEGSVSLQTF